MSGSRAITLRLDLAGASKLQEDLRNLGAAGEDALKRLEAAMKRPSSSGAGLPQLSAQTKEADEAFGKLTPKIQAAGYQLQDFFVQVQGGQGIMTALSQQGSQFLSAFGPTGVIAGAVLAVGALVSKLMDTTTSVDSIVKANESWKKSQEALNDVLETGAQRAERLAKAGLDAARANPRLQLSTAQTDIEKGGADVKRLEAALERLRGDYEKASPGSRGAVMGDIRETETALAAARLRVSTGNANADQARETLHAIDVESYGPPSRAYTGAAPDPVAEALRTSRDNLADSARLRGLNPQQTAIERARLTAEREADNLGMDAEKKKEYVTNQVTAAINLQTTAINKNAEAEEARLARAKRAGETEINRAETALDLAQKMANAASPREAQLAREKAAIDNATASLRARAEVETDPKIKSAVEQQIKDITRLRTEEQKYLETARGRQGLFQLQQAGERTDAYTKALGMSPNERARYLGEFSERQRIIASQDDPNSEISLQRIKKAGDVAYGDEQFRKLQDFTQSIQDMGSAFGDAFGAAISGGQKTGDILRSLERQLVSIATRAFITKPLENAFSGIAGKIGTGLVSSLAGTAIGNLFGAGGTKVPIDVGGKKFATGGIMTEFGPLPLRKYAGGGVARSPQVAIYGENRQPEAYVPLPDGRSIPVSMKGAGNGGSTIYIDARGADAGSEMRMRQMIAEAAPHIVAASEANLTAKVNRGGKAAQTFGRRR